MNPTRRSLLLGLGSLLAAPAIVRVANIMPISVMEEGWLADPVVDPANWNQLYFKEFLDNNWFKPFKGVENPIVLRAFSRRPGDAIHFKRVG